MKQLDNYLNLPAAVAAAADRIDREATRSLPPRKRREEEAASPTTSRPLLPLAFSRNSRSLRASVAHFQLRNLLFTPSLHEAYAVHASRLVLWDSVTRERTVVLDLSGGNDGIGDVFDDDWREMLDARAGGGAAMARPFANSRVPLPPLPAPPACSGAFPMLGSAAAAEAGAGGGGAGERDRNRVSPRRVLIGTAAVGLGLAALGGFNGEVAVVPTRGGSFLSSSSASSSSSRGNSSSTFAGSVGMRVTTSDNGITNGLEISGGAGRGSSTLPRLPDFGEGAESQKLSSSATSVTAANNDGFVRAFDASTWQRTLCVDCGWAVNFATSSPDGALLAAVGDDPAARLLDPRCCGSSNATSFQPTTRKSGVAVLQGHLDFSFAASWHPSGLLLATGNQDATARIWDLRNTKESLHVLKSELGAVRSLRFSPDGALLAAAEPADFVKVYDCRGEGGWGGSGGGNSVRLRARSSSSSRRDDEEEMREAGNGEQEEEEGLFASLPSGGAPSFAAAAAPTCGACLGGGCPRCVDLALRHLDGLSRLRRRRQLVMEQQQQQRQQQQRRKDRRREGGINDAEEDEGGLPLLGESTDDDENGENENDTSLSSSLQRRGPFETAQAIDFFGECAGISWSPCGTRLSVAVADATYSSLLQFDRA